MKSEIGNRKSEINLALLGAAGRMGRTLVRCVQAGAVPGLKLTGAVDLWDCPERDKDAGQVAGVAAIGVKIGSDLAAVLPQADVVIDFTGHHSTAGNAPRVAEAGKALVIGTTGLSAEEKKVIEQAAEKIPVVLAPNMSLGVNLLFSLVRQAAKTLKDKGYDIEIIERHHRRKKDSPSGTAIGLGEAAAEGLDWDLSKVAVHGRNGLVGERPSEEIGFHAVRGGDILGDHTVPFAADGECIELSHRVTNRDTLAIGALRAASWISGRKAGLYSMKDVLGL
ncbi:MAG: 4-hydroxy-tetrahydrodipicolinate reductase [Lentisphaerota bacterium]